jgi:cytochrome c biogenesis factor
VLSSKLVRKYARVFTVAARILGAWFVLCGTVFLVSAWVMPSDRVMNVLAGLFAIAVGVGMLISRRVTGEQLGAGTGSVDKGKG